ncbi:MAG: hypothetical protein J6K81_04270 [Rikenellaceae bacterium]|nr:hypothetical protein [Rikenellaceae bacterium]
MASVKRLKKDIDYLVEEVVTDCYLSIYFHSERKEEIVGVMNKAVELRNELFGRINSPAEPHNKSLVAKHYAQIRRDMFAGVDALFTELSELNK